MASNLRHGHSASQVVDDVTRCIEGEGIAKIIKAACTLEVFDTLADGTTSAVEIAGSRNWDANSLEALLSVCASLNLVEKHRDRDGTYKFSLLEGGRLLMKNEKGMPTLWEMAMGGGMGGHMADFEKMVKKVKVEEEPHHHGGDSSKEDPKFWDGLPLDVFRMMDGVGRPHADKLVSFFDLSHYKTAMDVGAGSGVMSVALCKKYPNLHVTLLDGKDTLQKAKDNFIPKEFEKRIAFLPGDALIVEMPKVDLILVSQLLHHISADKKDMFLTRLRDHLNPGGALMMFETIVNDKKDGPLMSMLWFGSDVERFAESPTADDFTKLMKKNGFTDVQLVQTQEMCFYDVIFAKKK